MIDESVKEELTITPHKYLNPFEPIPESIASSPNLLKDPIALVDPDDVSSTCIT